MSDETFDLGTNSSVPVSAVLSDAAGNVVTGKKVSYSVDDTTVLNLTDNGDGTAVVIRASSAGGSATVTATVTNDDGSTASGTLTVSVAAAGGTTGNVTNVDIVPGIPS